MTAQPSPPAVAVVAPTQAPTPTPTPAPVPAPPPANATAKTALDRLKLEAIFFSSQHPSVVINGQLASVNQLVAECRVLDIGPSSVTVEYQNQRRTLTIR